MDLVAAALTVTPERLTPVDFSTPTRTNVSELVVTAHGTPKVTTPDELAGREVFVRKSSSYYESLVSLNASLAARQRPLVQIKEAPGSARRRADLTIKDYRYHATAEGWARYAAHDERMANLLAGAAARRGRGTCNRR